MQRQIADQKVSKKAFGGWLSVIEKLRETQSLN